MPCFLAILNTSICSWLSSFAVLMASMSSVKASFSLAVNVTFVSSISLKSRAQFNAYSILSSKSGVTTVLSVRYLYSTSF